jgi:hypothetical protein
MLIGELLSWKACCFWMFLKQYGPLKSHGLYAGKRRGSPGASPASPAASYQPHVAGKNAGTVNYRRGSFAGQRHGEIRVREIIVDNFAAAGRVRASSWRLGAAWILL